MHFRKVQWQLCFLGPITLKAVGFSQLFSLSQSQTALQDFLILKCTRGPVAQLGLSLCSVVTAGHRWNHRFGDGDGDGEVWPELMEQTPCRTHLMTQFLMGQAAAPVEGSGMWADAVGGLIHSKHFMLPLRVSDNSSAKTKTPLRWIHYF